MHNGQFMKDITNDHLFTGYSPLIISLYDEKELPAHPEIVFYAEKDAIATIRLELIHEQKAGNIKISHYRGEAGNHRFLNRFHQFIISQKNRLYNKKKGNVYLHDNLYKQVQIAYSIPRNISLVTTAENNLYNLFPTDLHGPVTENFYLDSLRHEGKACQQVLRSGKMVISQVDAAAYQTVYSLGKNHMQNHKHAVQFPFGPIKSEKFGYPIPEAALGYRELQVEDSFTHGIHRIFLFRVVNRVILRSDLSSLAHIHNVYATWRHKKGLEGNYLLR
jgi:flavin reductase (DIM6/NTAB) family NADH-FMN oxidoreductase RutF